MRGDGVTMKHKKTATTTYTYTDIDTDTDTAINTETQTGTRTTDALHSDDRQGEVFTVGLWGS